MVVLSELWARQLEIKLLASIAKLLLVVQVSVMRLPKEVLAEASIDLLEQQEVAVSSFLFVEEASHLTHPHHLRIVINLPHQTLYLFSFAVILPAVVVARSSDAD